VPKATDEKAAGPTVKGMQRCEVTPFDRTREDFPTSRSRLCSVRRTSQSYEKAGRIAEVSRILAGTSRLKNSYLLSLHIPQPCAWTIMATDECLSLFVATGGVESDVLRTDSFLGGHD
jgi:hypothetical protein